MTLLETLSRIEESDDLHAARLLLLLKAFAGKQGKGEIEGLTKLAKLDFLMRYPVYLQRALAERGVTMSAVDIEEYERLSVESRMVRYKYGPWDHRYRRFINILVARGLAHVETRGRTINIGLTSKGLQIATDLMQRMLYRDQARRASLLKAHLDLPATKLMRFIYDTFPEIGSLRLGNEIS